jgi:hypothetical protein
LYKKRRLCQATSYFCLVGTALSFQAVQNAWSRPKRFSQASLPSDSSSIDTLLDKPDHSYSVDSLLEIEALQKENQLLKQSLQQLELENDRLHKSSRIVLENFEGEGKLRQVKEKYKDGSELNLPGEDPDIYNDPSLWCDELEDDACPLEPTVSFGQALRDRAYWLVGLLVLQSLSGIILSRNEALLDNHPFSKFITTEWVSVLLFTPVTHSRMISGWSVTCLFCPAQ